MSDDCYHSLLARQLRKAGIDPASADPKVQKLIELVNEYYVDSDSGRRLLERAIDISSREMSETNKKLQNLANDAQKAARFKSNFLANMSHEIRTPINGILGLAEILREKIRDRESLEMIELLSRSSRGLLSIINDVLDISKIEAGKFTILPRVSEIRPIIGDLVTLYSAAASERGLELVGRVVDSVPPEVIIDDGRLRQILTNLIGNAVKFTPDSGGVLVFVENRPFADGRAGIRFSVADSGIGIPKDHLESIFDAFSQVNGTISRKYGGTGLGLTITQQLVDIMGGEIEVRSRESIGSLFQITLPYEVVTSTNKIEAAGAIDTTPTQIDRGKVHILLVEDNLVNQRVAHHMLKGLGFRITMATNGRQALSAIMEAPFDLILMDCQMPEMSGFEATQLIRKLPERSQVPVVALTALAMEGDRERCIAAGMNDYLSKPFKKKDLEATILRWLRQKESERAV